MVHCSTCNVFHVRKFCRFVYCLAWFDTVEFNRLPCPNDKMYDYLVFANRFPYPLIMFGNRILIGLSRIVHAHNAYEIDTSKIIAVFCQISYCLYDLIRLNSIACRDRQHDLWWCSFRWSMPLSIDYVWHSCIDRVISTPSCSYCMWNRHFQNYRRILPNFLLFVWFDTVEFNRLPCPNDTMICFSLIDSDINWLCLKSVYW